MGKTSCFQHGGQAKKNASPPFTFVHASEDPWSTIPRKSVNNGQSITIDRSSDDGIAASSHAEIPARDLRPEPTERLRLAAAGPYQSKDKGMFRIQRLRQPT